MVEEQFLYISASIAGKTKYDRLATNISIGFIEDGGASTLARYKLKKSHGSYLLKIQSYVQTPYYRYNIPTTALVPS